MADITRIEQFLESESISPETVDQMEKLEQQVVTSHKYISYLQTLEIIRETENTIVGIQKELESKHSKINGLQIFLRESASITKLDVLKNRMDAFEIVPPFVRIGK